MRFADGQTFSTVAKTNAFQTRVCKADLGGVSISSDRATWHGVYATCGRWYVSSKLSDPLLGKEAVVVGIAKPQRPLFAFDSSDERVADAGVGLISSMVWGFQRTPLSSHVATGPC